MKKVLLIFITFLILVPKINASVSFYFSDGQEGLTNVSVRTWNTFDVYLSYNNENFDINYIMAKIKYDKKKIELVDISGVNDFMSVSKENISLRRSKIPKEDSKKAAKLTFKTKHSGKSTIKLTDLSAENLVQEISANDISIKVVSKVNYARISLIVCIISVLALVIYVFYPKVLKKIKR